MRFCYLLSEKSEDESTKVGAVIVNQDNITVSSGINGIPRGVQMMPEMQDPNGIKYQWFEHAERNAIYNATRLSVSLIGCRIYIPILPCMDCARGIMQTGIKSIRIHKAGQAAFLHSRGNTPKVWDRTQKTAWDAFQFRTNADIDWINIPLPGVTAMFSGSPYTFEVPNHFTDQDGNHHKVSGWIG